MDRLAEITGWLLREGRFTRDGTDLVEQFSARLRLLGVPVDRSWVHLRTLNPNFAGVSWVWHPDKPASLHLLDFGFERTETYLRSPVHLAVEQKTFFHWRLDAPDTPAMPTLTEQRDRGYVAYAIAPVIFSDGSVNAISWTTRDPAGFSTDDLVLLEAMLPILSATVEIKSLRQFARTVLATYVGREPAELILHGQIRRGDVHTATAALMLVDLRDFTSLSDTLAPAEVIEALNRYFDCVIPPVQRRGGEVMEFMGDAILVIFNESAERSAQQACRLAFDAAAEALAALAESNHAQPPGSIVLRAWFALHHGQVSYGNIGADDRLDFTVIGPDVNLTSRMERLCREIDRELIMSGDFAALLDAAADQIGHFRLRGFARMQLLFGLPVADAT